MLYHSSVQAVCFSACKGGIEGPRAMTPAFACCMRFVSKMLCHLTDNFDLKPVGSLNSLNLLQRVSTVQGHYLSISSTTIIAFLLICSYKRQIFRFESRGRAVTHVSPCQPPSRHHATPHSSHPTYPLLTTIPKTKTS